MNKTEDPSHFFFAGVTCCVITLAILGTLNWLVNPYEELSSPLPIPRQVKNEAFECMRRMKAADIRRLKPKAVLLGSSRILEGMDSTEVAKIVGTPCYNLGLAGANMEEIAAYFEYALLMQPHLQFVLLGIDFFAFNRHRPPKPDFSLSRLQQQPSWNDRIQTLATWKATQHSLLTAKRWLIEDATPILYTDLWGNTEEKVTDAFFDHRLPNPIERAKKDLKGSMTTPDLYGKFALSQEAVSHFEKIVRTCNQRGITLRVFISPCSLAYSYGLYLRGLWDTFCDLKAELARHTTIWDFSVENEATRLPLSSLHLCYFDTSHYRPHVGHRMLREMFGLEELTFGCTLPVENWEREKANTLQALQTWSETNQDTVDFLRTTCVEHSTSGEME